jgi:flagellar motor switch protein FliM
MTYGPVDFVALEFKGNQFKGEIFPELMKLVGDGVVRVIDIIVVKKDADGNVTHQEMQETDQSVLAVFDPLKAEINGMIQVEDIEMIGEKLENNCTAALLMFENLWAVNFVKAVENANGRSVMHVRIPHEVVVETMEKIAAGEAKPALEESATTDTQPEAVA